MPLVAYPTNTYLCGMSKKMTYLEAYDDFRKWIPTQPAWKTLTKRDKQYIAKADQARRLNKLGIDRVKSLLGKHAPQRYDFSLTVNSSF